MLPRTKVSSPDDYSPLYPSILATVVLCGILTTICTAARLMTKRLISSFDFADYMLMLAWLASVAFESHLLAAGMGGLGNHVWHLGKTRLVRLDLSAWTLDLLYIPTLWVAKASLLFQLICIITPKKSGPVYWACHTLLWGNLALYVPIFASVIFECHPVWEILISHYEDYCINQVALQVTLNAFNIFLDLLNLLLPIWAMWALQMIPKTKAGITAIYATGLFAFISSICRLAYSTYSISSTDFTYIDAQAALWGLAEITTIILCTCALTMPQFLKLIRDRSPSVPNPPLPSPIKKVRKSRIFKIDNAQSTVDTGPIEEAMARLKPPHRQVAGIGNDASEGDDVVRRDLEKKRMVVIKTASFDQLNAKSRVASMV